MRDMEGRVALITGAAGHIGFATARKLAARGARIVAVDRAEADLSRLESADTPKHCLVDVDRYQNSTAAIFGLGRRVSVRQ